MTIQKEERQITAVCQNGGRSTKLNIWNSNEHCAKFEHSYS